jgi:chromosome segregation ATPase
MSKLESIDTSTDLSCITVEDITILRRQLNERSILLKEGLERMRQTQEELDSTKRRRDEAEGRLATLETEYEELLGTCKCLHDICFWSSFLPLQRRLILLNNSATVI